MLNIILFKKNCTLQVINLTPNPQNYDKKDFPSWAYSF